MAFPITVAMVIAGLAQLVLHWMPWRALLGKELPRQAAYILGTLAMALPLTGLLLTWSLFWAAGALWAVLIGSGMAVLGAYLLDEWLSHRVELRDALQREKALLKDGQR